MRFSERQSNFVKKQFVSVGVKNKPGGFANETRST